MNEFVVNHLMDGFLLTAFPIALLAGLISFISPCVLPLVPGYLSFAAGFSRSRGRVFLGSILFVLGFSVLFISYVIYKNSVGVADPYNKFPYIVAAWLAIALAYVAFKPGLVASVQAKLSEVSTSKDK